MEWVGATLWAGIASLAPLALLVNVLEEWERKQGIERLAEVHREKMSAEVVALHRNGVVETLREVLDKAETGEIVSVTVVGRLLNGDILTASSGSDDVCADAGALLRAAIARLG